MKIIDLNDSIALISEEYEQDQYEIQTNKVNIWLMKLNDELAKLDQDQYTKRMVSLYYTKFIYDKVFVERISVSDLSREIGITYWSIRNTIQNIKRQINDEAI